MNRPGASDSSGRSWGKFGRTLGRREAGVKSAKTTATPDRERYDPRRFQGQGVLFKGKLIGVLAVTEARGDRMCQDALAELKMAIRAAGEHKQKVVISVNIDGLRLRDERSGDCLYHHPVHKISFIAQDMTDKRAFGYVFGSPDTGHQFFGVKTEKDAGQVVMAMRDLFQVVFELKKQEMEKKKQRIADEQLKAKTGSSTMSRQSSGGKSGVSAAPSWALGKATLPDSASGLSVFSGHSVDLLDLQQEIENIEQGISQMDRMSPTDGSGSGSGRDSVPAGGSPATSRAAPTSASAAAAMAVVAAAEDPFGDSFVASPRLTRRGRTTSSGGSGSSGAPIAIAPPPPALAKSRHSSSGSGRGGTPQPAAQPPPPPGAPAADSDPRPTVAVDPFDLFTDLDPLGSGKAKPYVDKKDFFSDLKKPAKRRLDELSGRVEGAAVGQSGPQPPRPLDKHTLMELYESEERRKAEATALDSSGELATTVNGASGSDSALFEASFSHSDDEKPGPAAAAAGATFSTDFSVFDFDAVRTAGATALTGEPEPRRADSPPAFSPPPVPLPPPPSRQRTAASSRSGSSSPATLRRAHLKPGGGSSDTLADLPSDPGEPAPEPPPRPPLVQPPPLPPKKAPQHVTMKPPPRPPHTELRWEASAPAGIATPESGSGSPPLPVPARRPRQTREHPDLVRASSLGGAAVHRKARETASLGFTSLPPLTTEPVTEPPPVNRHTKDRARALAPPAFEPTPPPQPGPPPQQQPPADMLTQLQSTSLTELASKLHISVDRLAQMSVIELAACLVASGSAAVPVPAAPPPPAQPTEEESQEESPSEEFKSLSPISSPEVSIYKSPQLQRRDLGRGDALRSPLDQLLAMASSPPPPASASPPAPPAAVVARVQPEPISRPEPAQLQTVEEDVFARFDARFPRSPLDTPNSVDDFHCEFPEAAAPPAPAALAAAPAADKYAVFRELEAELTGERLAASAPVSDDSDAEPTDAVITPPAAAADPWSMFSGQPGGADPFRDGYGAAGEPASVPAVQDFARFDREFGAGAGPTVSALAGAEISWPQEGEPVLDSPTAATGNGWSVASAEDSGLRERGDEPTFDPDDHARLGAADSGSAAGIDDHQFGPPDFSAQFGSQVGMFGTAEASRAGPLEAVPSSVSDAVGWGAAVAAVADGEREGFSPAPDSGWERLSSPPAAEPAWQRAETLRAQTSQFDDDFVVSDERGSLADEVTFDERRRSPLADDVFGGTDPWTTPPTGAAAAPAAAADPFADDEFFQAPAPAGIQKDPFKQDPFERSWASDFNAGARTQQQ